MIAYQICGITNEGDYNILTDIPCDFDAAWRTAMDWHGDNTMKAIFLNEMTVERDVPRLNRTITVPKNAVSLRHLDQIASGRRPDHNRHYPCSVAGHLISDEDADAVQL